MKGKIPAQSPKMPENFLTKNVILKNKKSGGLRTAFTSRRWEDGDQDAA